MLATSVTLLWIVVAALVVVVLALARQVGVLYERIAPMGALVSREGVAVGSPAPAMTLATLGGEALAIGQDRPRARPLLLLFVAGACPVCRKIVPLAKAVALAEGFDLAFIGDDDDATLREMSRRYALDGYPFANSPALGLAFQVSKLPYAVLLDTGDRVAAKGLVNTREHLESLAVARETGFATAQAYLRDLARSGPPQRAEMEARSE